MSGSAFTAGLYLVESKLSDTDFVIHRPECRVAALGRAGKYSWDCCSWKCKRWRTKLSRLSSWSGKTWRSHSATNGSGMINQLHRDLSSQVFSSKSFSSSPPLRTNCRQSNKVLMLSPVTWEPPSMKSQTCHIEPWTKNPVDALGEFIPKTQSATSLFLSHLSST